MSPQISIALSVLLPFLGALGIGLTGRWPNLRESVTVGVSLLTFAIVLSLAGPVMQ